MAITLPPDTTKKMQASLQRYVDEALDQVAKAALRNSLSGKP